jgi:hypothetical protein
LARLVTLHILRRSANVSGSRTVLSLRCAILRRGFSGGLFLGAADDQGCSRRKDRWHYGLDRRRQAERSLG